MKKLLLTYISVLFFVTVTIGFAGAIIERFEASSNGEHVLVTWQSSEEEGVKEYNLMRSTSLDGNYSVIHTLKAKGEASIYEYKDKSVYKSELKAGSFYCYKLEIVMKNGKKASIKAISVHHNNPSGIKKTWGSIKALFR